MKVRIYVEGGGDQRATLSACREGFAEFFGKLAPENRRPKIIPCGNRRSTFDDFRIAIEKHLDSFVILLVDAEDPIRGATRPSAHLRERDGWDVPAGVTDDHVHLMVQCTESWFLAQKEMLVEFYGDGFHEAALPGNPNIEQILKRDVLQGLAAATRHVIGKGIYQKVRHGYKLVGLLNPARVRGASPHAERLCGEVFLRLEAD